ncbi:hypothetical protein HDV57DRAFT_75239 [Trichoderma longibrachiatum]
MVCLRVSQSWCKTRRHSSFDVSFVHQSDCSSSVCSFAAYSIISHLQMPLSEWTTSTDSDRLNHHRRYDKRRPVPCLSLPCSHTDGERAGKQGLPMARSAKPPPPSCMSVCAARCTPQSRICLHLYHDSGTREDMYVYQPQSPSCCSALLCSLQPSPYKYKLTAPAAGGLHAGIIILQHVPFESCWPVPPPLSCSALVWLPCFTASSAAKVLRSGYHRPSPGMLRVANNACIMLGEQQSPCSVERTDSPPFSMQFHVCEVGGISCEFACWLFVLACNITRLRLSLEVSPVPMLMTKIGN